MVNADGKTGGVLFGEMEREHHEHHLADRNPADKTGTPQKGKTGSQAFGAEMIEPIVHSRLFRGAAFYYIGIIFDRFWTIN